MPCEAKCGQALRGLPRLTKTETCKIENCARRSVPLANGRGGLAFIEGYPTQAVPAGTPNWIACLARLPDGRANA